MHSNAVFSSNSAEGISVMYVAPGAYASFGPNPSFVGNKNADPDFPAFYLDADESVDPGFYSKLVMGAHAQFANPGGVDVEVQGGRTYCEPNAGQDNYPDWTSPTYKSYEQPAGTYACSSECTALTVKAKLTSNHALAAGKTSSAKVQVQVMHTSQDTLDDVTVELDLPGGVVYSKASVRPKKNVLEPTVLNGGQRLVWSGLSFKGKDRLSFLVEVNTAAATCPLTFSGAAYVTVGGIRTCDAYYSAFATTKAKKSIKSSVHAKN